MDVSKSLPGVPDDRADGLHEMQALTAQIGVEAQALLFHRVYERQTFTWMAGQGMGDERGLAVPFLLAVDAVGRFYGLGRPSKAVEEMEIRLAAVG